MVPLLQQAEGGWVEGEEREGERVSVSGREKGTPEKGVLQYLICNNKFPNSLKVVQYWLECSN